MEMDGCGSQNTYSIDVALRPGATCGGGDGQPPIIFERLKAP